MCRWGLGACSRPTPCVFSSPTSRQHQPNQPMPPRLPICPLGLLTHPAGEQLCHFVSGQLDPRLDSEQKLRMLRTRPPRFFRSREQALKNLVLNYSSSTVTLPKNASICWGESLSARLGRGGLMLCFLSSCYVGLGRWLVIESSPFLKMGGRQRQQVVHKDVSVSLLGVYCVEKEFRANQCFSQIRMAVRRV